MEDIRMGATKAPYAHLKAELDAAFSGVMESMSLTDGPQVNSFARKLEQYLHVPHAFPCASDTLALRLALTALRLPAGAEVVMPALNDASGAKVVAQLGLKPVFADVLSGTFTLDPASVAKAITPATAVLLPVHLFGQCAPMAELLELAQQHKLWVVEDASQALGAVYSKPDGQQVQAGGLGHFGFSSFFPSKPTGGTGDGGALFLNEEALLGEASLLYDQRQRQDDDPEKPRVHYRLANLQAAMLEVKITYLDTYNAARREVARFYDRALAQTEQVQVPQIASYSSHVYHHYTVSVAPERRDGLQQHLLRHHIPSMIYYPKPLHLQDEFAYLGYKKGDFPVSEALAASMLSLPMHAELKEDQLTYIGQHITEFLSNAV